MLKLKIAVLIFISIFVFSLNFTKIKTTNKEVPLLGKIIYIDPGHGGTF